MFAAESGIDITSVAMLLTAVGGLSALGAAVMLRVQKRGMEDEVVERVGGELRTTVRMVHATQRQTGNVQEQVALLRQERDALRQQVRDLRKALGESEDARFHETAEYGLRVEELNAQIGELRGEVERLREAVDEAHGGPR